jgi:hypothetical protein
MFLLFALTAAIKKKDEILDLDQHRFRKIVFHREFGDVWVSGMSSPDFPGHTQTMTALDDAFKLAKGFLKFAYLDSVKSTYLSQRLHLSKQPYFCFFYTGGDECRPATNLSARDVVNIGSAFLMDCVKTADAKWLKTHKQNPTAILFTEQEQTPVLWRAIEGVFRRTPLKIGLSRDRDFAKSLNVTLFPTILLHNFTHNLVYEGENEYTAMKLHLKKFMTNRLLKVKPALKVRPLADYRNSCQGPDTICIVHAVSEPASELEILRLKHRTSLFEFFFGTGGEYKSGSIAVNWPHKNRYIEVDGFERLEKVLGEILNGTAVWNEISVAEDEGTTATAEDEEGI